MDAGLNAGDSSPRTSGDEGGPGIRVERRPSLRVLRSQYLDEEHAGETFEPVSLRGKMDLMNSMLDELRSECEASSSHSVVLNAAEISTLTQVIEHFVTRVRTRTDAVGTALPELGSLRDAAAAVQAHPTYEEQLRKTISNAEIYDAQFRNYIHREFLTDIRVLLKRNGYDRPAAALHEIYDADLETIRTSGVGLGVSGRRREARSFVSTMSMASSQEMLGIRGTRLDSTDLDGDHDGLEDLSRVTDEERGKRRRSSIASLQELMNLPADMVTLLNESMARVRNWDFDIFELSDLGVQFPVLHIGTAILGVELGLVGTLELDKSKLAAYLLEVDVNYDDENPYHCALHAADVAQAMFHFMAHCGVGDELSLVESLAAIIAALTHDIGHLGVTGAFLVQTGHELAMLYNDHSPLENMHAARAFQLLADPSMDFVSHWRFNPGQRSPRHRRRSANDVENYQAPKRPSGRRFARFRYTVIEMIIATDNSQHKHLMTQMSAVQRDLDAQREEEEASSREERAQSGTSNSSGGTLVRADSEFDILKPQKGKTGAYDEEQRLFLLKTVLHAADVGNPARPWHTYIRWTDRLMEEFYAQGDREKELGYPVSPGFDRDAPVPMHAFQRGFMLALVQPLFEALDRLPGANFSGVRTQLSMNLDRWAKVESGEIEHPPAEAGRTAAVRALAVSYEDAEVTLEPLPGHRSKRPSNCTDVEEVANGEDLSILFAPRSQLQPPKGQASPPNSSSPTSGPSSPQGDRRLTVESVGSGGRETEGVLRGSDMSSTSVDVASPRRRRTTTLLKPLHRVDEQTGVAETLGLGQVRED